MAAMSRWRVRAVGTGDERSIEVPDEGEAGERRPGVVVGARRRASRLDPAMVEVVVHGWRFELEVEESRRAMLRGRAIRDRTDTGTHAQSELRAMIPGRIVSVSVAVGDSVTRGQPLLVVEAMKMQNELRSPRDGVVARLAVGPGRTIELGDVLIVIEDG
jgi:biotin carboxyl carrier protein